MRALFGLAGLLLGLAADNVHAGNGHEGRSLSFTIENDSIGPTDRHYTQGGRIAYWSADGEAPGWLESASSYLPAVGLTVEAQKWGIAVNQEMYTPEDLTRSDLIVRDRPYAGWLFLTLGLERRGPAGFWNWSARERFSLQAGVVGRESLAESAQKWWHGVINATTPRGWDNQLGSEPGFNTNYRRDYRWVLTPPSSIWEVDMIPHLGVSAGTVMDNFSGGAQFRAGYNIPNEFEVAHQSEEGPTHRGFGMYLFGGGEGRWVLRSEFLDGTIFHSSHSVGKYPWVGDYTVGATLAFARWELSVAQIFRSREFRSQPESDTYTSIVATIKF